MSSQNDFAKTLKSLHIPGNPIVLTNVWDGITASAVAPLPQVKALATASYAVAVAAGLEDAELDLDTNVRAIRTVARIAKAHGRPLTADFQDGYGDRLEEGIRQVIKAGVAGINLEDFGRELGKEGELYTVDVAVDRIKRVLRVAADEGVPDFVINARTDALITGLSIDDAIARGKTYLAAGAHNVFIWGGSVRGGVTREEVQKAANELGGRLNVSLRLMPNSLTVPELKDIGVARISIGPQLSWGVQEVVKAKVEEILG